MKKTVCVLLFMGVVISLFAGCSFFTAKNGDAKEFSSDGLTLTLTDKFSKAEIEGYTVCYDSFDVAVFALKESFADYPQLEGLTLDEYKEYVLEANASKAPKEDTSIKDLTVLRFEYYIADKKANYTYFVTLYQASDSFWLVQFACKSSEYADYEQYFVKWARSIRV